MEAFAKRSGFPTAAVKALFANGQRLTVHQLTLTGSVGYGTEGADTLSSFADHNTHNGYAGEDSMTDGAAMPSRAARAMI